MMVKGARVERVEKVEREREERDEREEGREGDRGRERERERETIQPCSLLAQPSQRREIGRRMRFPSISASPIMQQPRSGGDGEHLPEKSLDIVASPPEKGGVTCQGEDGPRQLKLNEYLCWLLSYIYNKQLWLFSCHEAGSSSWVSLGMGCH